jgi:uncharacterized membrane protein (DUF485 family)
MLNRKSGPPALCALPWLIRFAKPAANQFMSKPNAAKTDIHSEAFLHSLMRRQLKLSIACAGAFLLVLLGLPLLNYFFPEAMQTRVFGFTLTWFVLGVLFFPFVWAIAWVFIRRSMDLEESEVNEAKQPADSAKGEGQ